MDPFVRLPFVSAAVLLPRERSPPRPLSEEEDAAARARDCGRPVRALVAQGEGHGLSRRGSTACPDAAFDAFTKARVLSEPSPEPQLALACLSGDPCGKPACRPLL